ncbi:MAG: YIP1 family protein [Anaerolineae bacterium]|jgi:hypothetical protein
MLTFARYSAALIFRPRATLRVLSTDSRRLTFGFASLLLLTAVYVLGLSVAIAGGRMPEDETLLLRIPVERYYVYERVFLLPAAIGGTILAAGATRLTAHLWDGEGRFEDLFALLGFTQVVVPIFMGLPDLILFFLVPERVVTFHVWPVTLWYLVLAVLCVREIERLSWGKSIVSALAGALATGALQFLIMR